MIGRYLLLAAAFTWLTTSCSSTDEETIDVYAASSLTDAFSAFETHYERDHPGVDIRLNLAGSNALQRQILDGADADVFAPADIDLLEPLRNGETPLLYAANELTLVIPVEGEQRVRQPADLDDEGILLARCASGVPCGDAADRYLAGSDLIATRSTDEPNVRSVLTKVARGEADAGFVYVTDARANSDVTEIPLDGPPVISYGVMTLSTDPEAESFVAFVGSPEAAAILVELGFTLP